MKEEFTKTQIHKKTLESIIEDVSKFSAGVIIKGENETIDQQLVNHYADGVVQGYNDAVKQIVEYLKDLRNE